MVMVTAVLVFVSGLTVVDGLQSSSELENAERAMLSTEDQLRQVAETGESRVLPVTDVDGSRSLVREEGAVTVGWYGPSYDASTIHAPGETWQNNGSSHATELDPLGAIELRHDDVSYVYQGGAVWRETEHGTVVESPPAIERQNGTIRFDLRQVHRGASDSARTVASFNTSLTDSLRAARQAPDVRHFGIVVDSEYHEAWNRSLHQELDTDTAEIVHRGSTVRVLLRNATRPARIGLDGRPEITVHGGNATGSHGHRIPATASSVTLAAPLRNEGESVETRTVSTTLPGTGTRTVTLDPDERRTIRFTANASRLTAAGPRSIPYDVRTGSGRSLLNRSGRIAVGPKNATVTSGSTSMRVHRSDGHRIRTIGVNVTNTGISPGRIDATLELVYRGSNPTAPRRQTFTDGVRLRAGERTQLSWRLQAASLAEGPYEYRIDVGGSGTALTGTFHTPGGYGNTITAEGNVSIEIRGTEVSLHRTHSGTCRRWRGDCDKGWMPVTASVLFNGTEVQRLPSGSPQHGRFEYTEADHNLNTPQDWGRTRRFEGTVTRPTPISLRVSVFNCGRHGLDWGYTDATDVTDGWDDRRCAAGLGPPYHVTNPFQDRSEGNLVVLRDGDRVRNLEQPGVGQRSVTEMLGNLVDDDTGRLDLAPEQAVFLAELTEPSANYAAVDPDDPGDPNFNDFVGLFEGERVTPAIQLQHSPTGRLPAGPGAPTTGVANASSSDVEVQVGGQRLTVD
jgi:hypothetical protein